MSEDICLLSLVTVAGRLRGRRFVLKAEEELEVADKWLCLFAGVTPMQVSSGPATGGNRSDF